MPDCFMPESAAAAYTRCYAAWTSAAHTPGVMLPSCLKSVYSLPLTSIDNHDGCTISDFSKHCLHFHAHMHVFGAHECQVSQLLRLKGARVFEP